MGTTVAFVTSLLVRETDTPPAGAGAGKLTGNGADSPARTVTLPGRMIAPKTTTSMFADVSTRFGNALARTFVEPAAIAVTATDALVMFVANVTLAGTVATAASSELRLTVKPGGASAERFSVMFLVTPAATVRVPGEKLSVAVTRTCWLSPARPGADALMVEVPKLMPFTSGWETGVVAPAATNTVGGVTVTFEVSLLESVMVTPPAGAPVTKLTSNGTDWPVPMVTFAGSLIAPNFVTVTLAGPLM